MQHNEMAVRVGGAEESGHVADFGGGLGVFFADVPIECQRMTEAGDHFPAVEFAFGAELSGIEGGGDGAGLALVSGAVVVHFVFLQFEMQVETVCRGMIEDDAPLVEFRAIVVELRVAFDEGPDVVAIAAGVVGEEGKRVHAFACEVVERADESFAFATAPLWVAFSPVADVRLPGFERDVFLVGLGAIEVHIGEQGFG